MTDSRWVRVGVGGALVVFGIALQLPISVASRASAETSLPASSSAFTKSESLTRDHLAADGSDVVADSRNFTVTVDRTVELRGNQQLKVSWSGAHPTGGVVGDESSSTAAAYEEYPVVLMECRGIDSPSAPADKRLGPTTCWTQTTSERYTEDNNSAFPAWRLDRFASAADTAPNAGQPNPLDPKCVIDHPQAARWVPFVAADGTRYQPGYFSSTGCSPLAPEASNVENTGAPGNTTYAVTDPAGKGAAKFLVWTADQNASLGCSDTVPCSLVVIPIMGVSCIAPTAGDEAAADDASCRSTGVYRAGEPFNPAGSVPAVTGDLWWTASNWRNRVTVPLTFAQSSSVCSVVNNGTPLLIYGSPVIAEATGQWSPAFCTNPKRFTFRHVQTGEPSVKNLLGLGLQTPANDGGPSPSSSTSPSASVSSSSSPSPSTSASGGAPPTAEGVEAVMESDAPAGGYSRPMVQAPIAVTGFAISYIIDDLAGHEYTSLRLSPRLLAKLMTESYPDISAVYNRYTALAHNPVNITQDPEFIALNPGLPRWSDGEDSAAALYALSSNADTMFALTSYINVDPEARAWLNGTPDAWGMTVNPNYRGMALPVESWPLLDSYIASFGHAGNNDCIDDAPVPYLPLVASPTSTLSAVAMAVQFASPLSQTSCVLGGGVNALGNKLTTPGRQTPGFRFMLGLTSLGDANYFGLDTAALQTYQVAPDPTARFTSAVGRLFAAPTDDSLIAAARLASPDLASGTWPIPYAAMRNNPSDSLAYPGTMFVYLAAPAAGLPKQDAAELATFLRFAVTTGQTPGFGNGELPPGFAPMTLRNGLGDQVRYALLAASAINAQSGVVPDLLGPAEISLSAPASASASGSEAGPASAAPTTASARRGGQQQQPVVQPTVAAATPIAPAPSGPAVISASPSPSASTVALNGTTVAKSSSLAASLLPSVLACALGGMLIAQGLRFKIRRRP